MVCANKSYPFSFSLANRRTGAYPSGGGKGHDTAILGSWLEVELSSASVASVARLSHRALLWLSPPIQVYFTHSLSFIEGCGCSLKGFSAYVPKDHPLSEVLEVVKYMNRASGSFWRTLYANGFFLSPDVATTAISAGWAMVDA